MANDLPYEARHLIQAMVSKAEMSVAHLIELYSLDAEGGLSEGIAEVRRALDELSSVGAVQTDEERSRTTGEMRTHTRCGAIGYTVRLSRDDARVVSETLHNVSEDMNLLLESVRHQVSAESLSDVVHAVANVMAAVYIEVQEPLWDQYPCIARR